MGILCDLEQDVDGVEVEEGLEGDVVEDEEGPEVEVQSEAGVGAAEEVDVQVLGVEAGLGEGNGLSRAGNGVRGRDGGAGPCFWRGMDSEVDDADGAGGGWSAVDRGVVVIVGVLGRRRRRTGGQPGGIVGHASWQEHTNEPFPR